MATFQWALDFMFDDIDGHIDSQVTISAVKMKQKHILRTIHFMTTPVMLCKETSAAPPTEYR
jgi:hypothetical protein